MSKRKFSISLNGEEVLSDKLQAGANISVVSVIKEATTELLRSAKMNTPVDTGKLKQHLYAEMPQASQSSPEGTVYYTMHYAPHVEYGHRTVSGGYVEGQYYLKKSVDETEDKFREKIKEVVKNAT